jgi:putative transposase
MKQRFTEEQIVTILKEGESGTKVGEICRKYGISDATYYIWRKRYKGMDIPDVKKMKRIEEENLRLKKIVADQAMDIHVLKELLKKA